MAWLANSNSTDEMHGKARIREIQTAEITKRLETYREVAVVAGFQGLSPKGRIATLGRGGSILQRLPLHGFAG